MRFLLVGSPVLSFVPFPAFAGAVPNELFIRVNQVGYRLAEGKIAVAFAASPLPGTFSVIDASTRKVAYNGVAKRVSGKWGQFAYHADLDFSALTKAG